MKLLLDTHTLLWFINGDTKLSDFARSTIEDQANNSLISIVSLWEMGIKLSLGKLKLNHSFEKTIEDVLTQYSFDLLQLSVANIARANDLVFHHRDPFDRMLVAPSMTENIPIVSIDSIFDQYSVQRIW